MNKAAALVVIMLIGLSVMPQAPQVKPSPQSQVRDPCAVVVAAADLQTKTKTELLDEANRKNDALRKQLNEAGARLTIEQGNSASLVAKSAEKDWVIVGRDKVIARQAATLAIVTAQRDEADRKIEKANRRQLCRKFHWFCVK